VWYDEAIVSELVDIEATEYRSILSLSLSVCLSVRLPVLFGLVRLFQCQYKSIVYIHSRRRCAMDVSMPLAELSLQLSSSPSSLLSRSHRLRLTVQMRPGGPSIGISPRAPRAIVS